MENIVENRLPKIEDFAADEKKSAEDEGAFRALWAIAAPGITYEQVIGVIAATRGGYLPGITAEQTLAEYADRLPA